MPKLLSSYTLDAIDEQARCVNSKLSDVERFLSTVVAADISEHVSVDECNDLRISGPGLSGGALSARKRIIPFCAFRATNWWQRNNGRDHLIA